jgi:hypothetical protein
MNQRVVHRPIAAIFRGAEVNFGDRKTSAGPKAGAGF